MSNVDSGQKKIMLGIAVGALVVGYAAGSLVTGQIKWQQGVQAGSAQTRMELAKTLESSGLIPQDFPLETLSGKIVAINGNVIDIEVGNVETNPLLPPTPSIRRVTIPDGANVMMLKHKSDEAIREAETAFAAAEDKFVKAMEAGEEAQPPEPVHYYDNEAATMSDVTVGLTATVSSSNDIRRAPSFSAESVILSSDSIETIGGYVVGALQPVDPRAMMMQPIKNDPPDEMPVNDIEQVPEEDMMP